MQPGGRRQSCSACCERCDERGLSEACAGPIAEWFQDHPASGEDDGCATPPIDPNSDNLQRGQEQVMQCDHGDDNEKSMSNPPGGARVHDAPKCRPLQPP